MIPEPRSVVEITSPFNRYYHVRAGRLLATLIVGVAASSLFSCSDSTSPDITFFGPITTVAGGTVRSYVILDRSGTPTELGLTLTEAALTGLPATAVEFVFQLPDEASATPFKHAVINWQPVGHGAAGTVYTAPHFDIHYYTITQSEREAIVLGDAQLAAKMARVPSAEFIPAGYVSAMGIARMGLHWNDPAAPERNGQPFTYTFLYGSYDGAFVFAEPMVTKAYLETKPAAVVTPVKLPAQYATRGYQPTSYTVGYDAGAKEYRVALTGLVLR